MADVSLYILGLQEGMEVTGGRAAEEETAEMGQMDGINTMFQHRHPLNMHHSFVTLNVRAMPLDANVCLDTCVYG
jgi:hypothetical protein